MYTDLIAASDDSKICKETIVKGSVILIPGKIIIAKGIVTFPSYSNSR